MADADQLPAAAPRPICEVKRALAQRLRQHRAVVGVGIGATRAGKERITVYLAEDTPEARALVPASAGGYPVAIKVSGRIYAHAGAKPGGPTDESR